MRRNRFLYSHTKQISFPFLPDSEADEGLGDLDLEDLDDDRLLKLLDDALEDPLELGLAVRDL